MKTVGVAQPLSGSPCCVWAEGLAESVQEAAEAHSYLLTGSLDFREFCEQVVKLLAA